MLWSIRVCSRGFRWHIESLRASTRPNSYHTIRRFLSKKKKKERKQQTYLSSSIYDMTVIFNPFINDALHIGGFDGRIIRINKMVLKRIYS